MLETLRRECRCCGVPGWRNWQTRRTQNPVLAREWEFDPPSGHQAKRCGIPFLSYMIHEESLKRDSSGDVIPNDYPLDRLLLLA